VKIKFDTKSGVDTKKWQCLLEVSCTPEGETPGELLNSGWLLDPIKKNWYMSRSVRIDLSKWSAGDSSLRCVNSYDWRKISAPNEEDRELLRVYREARSIIDYPYSIYEKYGIVDFEKGFSDLGNCWYMTVHFDNVSLYPICAFEKSGRKTSPGKACWTRACQVSKDRGSKYLYVCEGYGSGSAYKANSIGFEWWDGTCWSDDRDVYLDCLKDDGIIDES